MVTPAAIAAEPVWTQVLGTSLYSRNVSTQPTPKLVRNDRIPDVNSGVRSRNDSADWNGPEVTIPSTTAPTTSDPTSPSGPRRCHHTTLAGRMFQIALIAPCRVDISTTAPYTRIVMPTSENTSALLTNCSICAVISSASAARNSSTTMAVSWSRAGARPGSTAISDSSRVSAGTRQNRNW